LNSSGLGASAIASARDLAIRQFSGSKLSAATLCIAATESCQLMAMFQRSASKTASSGKNLVRIVLSSLTLIKELFQTLNITMVLAHRELGRPIVVC